MKKILITGANSYIGTSFENHMKEHAPEYQIETLDVIGDGWKKFDFSEYDSIIHVAGIAHQKETTENASLYYKVNCDLAVQLAKKAKDSGAKHFIFMSSMSIYGVDQGTITPNTQPTPNSHYGKSKLKAEQLLQELADDNFILSILRPPMVYGKNCRGNFQLLLKLAKKSPIFPEIQNKRSMISIGNLCSFIQHIVVTKEGGIFCPQNKEYVNTTDMVRLIAKNINRTILFSHIAGFAVNLLIPYVGKAKKAFASLIYEDCEKHNFDYCIENFEDSVKKSI